MKINETLQVTETDNAVDGTLIWFERSVITLLKNEPKLI